MPCYEYECKKCNREEEHIYTTIPKEEKEVICFQCGDIMTRIISKSSFKLKGRGWSSDNYHKD